MGGGGGMEGGRERKEHELRAKEDKSSSSQPPQWDFAIKDRCFPENRCFSLRNSLPVRIDWSTRRVVDFMEVILMSAGTLSPTVG